MGQYKNALIEYQEKLHEMESALSNPEVDTAWSGFWWVSPAPGSTPFIAWNPSLTILDSQSMLQVDWDLRSEHTPSDPRPTLLLTDLPQPARPEQPTMLVAESIEGDLVEMTYLGNSLWAIMGYPSLTLGVERERQCLADINDYILHNSIRSVEELEFQVEALGGQFSGRIIGADLWLNADAGNSAQLLSLSEIDQIEGDHFSRWDEEIIFEGFREEAPLDGSSIIEVPDGAAAILIDILNTPLSITEKELGQLISDPEIALVPSQVPESLFIAALLAHSWDERIDSRPDDTVGEWSIIAGTIVRSDEDAKFLSIDEAWAAIASYLSKLDNARIETLAEHALNNLRSVPESLTTEQVERRLQELITRLQWSAHRPDLTSDIKRHQERGVGDMVVTATNTQTGLAVKFQLGRGDDATLRISPQLPQHMPHYVDSFHEEGECLVWRSVPGALNTAEVQLSHWLLHEPTVIAALIVTTLERSGLFDPHTLAWAVG